MLEVKLTGQCGHSATRSGWSVNKDIDSTTPEAFARWLHHHYSPNSTAIIGGISFCCSILFLAVSSSFYIALVSFFYGRNFLIILQYL